MPDVWRVKPGAPSKGGVPTWDVFCGTEHHGTEFESREEAVDFIRESLPVGWSTDWPAFPGWYWFWDPSSPGWSIQAGQMRLVDDASFFYLPTGLVTYDGDYNYPDCQWCLMEKPPDPPKE